MKSLKLKEIIILIKMDIQFIKIDHGKINMISYYSII